MIRGFILATALWWVSTPLVAMPSPSVWVLEVEHGWSVPSMILLTGFGPFGGVRNNPSGRVSKFLGPQLKQACGELISGVHSSVLPVVPGIIEKFNSESYHKVINIGVAAGSESIRLERYARNRYEDPDTGISTLIDSEKKLDYILEGALPPPHLPPVLEGFQLVLGDEYSAGTYVCNDTYYRVTRKKRNGYFIHIPNIAESADIRLGKGLSLLICQILAQ